MLLVSGTNNMFSLIRHILIFLLKKKHLNLNFHYRLYMYWFFPKLPAIWLFSHIADNFGKDQYDAVGFLQDRVKSTTPQWVFTANLHSIPKLSLVLSRRNFSCCLSRSFFTFSSCSCFFFSFSTRFSSASSSFCRCICAILSLSRWLIRKLFGSWKDKWAAICNFQQCDILTSVDSDEPVQPKLQKLFAQ